MAAFTIALIRHKRQNNIKSKLKEKMKNEKKSKRHDIIIAALLCVFLKADAQAEDKERNGLQVL